MALSTVVKNFTDGSVQLIDNAALTATIQFSDGDFSVDGLAEQLNEVSAYETRGTFNTLRHTTRMYPTFSFSAQVTGFTNSSANLATDTVLRNGAFAAAVSTFGANADVYTLDVKFTMEGTNFGDSADHTFTLEDCRCTIAFAEGDPNKVTISGTCYGAITGDLAV
jgi:hypothetical protein